MISKARLYLPLVGFVVPTVVIGYGFVIPCSVIAGLNSLTIGFGTTILGAIITYIAGIRLALAPSCPTPKAGRFARYLNRQAAAPRGLFGRLLGIIWLVEHRRENRAALELLQIEPDHDVVDVGCGPGWAVHEASKLARRGRVIGLDISEAMVSSARHRNRRAITSERVEVRKVASDCFGLGRATFDRILAVHCIYFWDNPKRALAELVGALRPDGRLVLVFRPKGPDVPVRFRDPFYRFSTIEEVRALLAEAAAATGLDVEIDTSRELGRLAIACLHVRG